MSEWWTYSLESFLLFSPQTYYRLFALHQAAVWPAQILALAFGLLLLGAVWRPAQAGAAGVTPGLFSRTAPLGLAVCWLWVAWSYLHTHYASINWAAEYLAIGFVVQALLLAGRAVAGQGLAPGRGWPAQAGAGLVALGFAYPLLAPAQGRPFAEAELFGLAPDPTVLVTLGLLLAAARPHPGLLAIPLAWCAISAATLWTLRAPEAWLLIGAGLGALAATAGKRWVSR